MTVEEYLKKLVQNNEIDIYSSPRMLKAHLLDICKPEKREINLIIGVLEEGVINDIEEIDNSNVDIKSAILIKKYSNNCGFSEDYTYWALNTWAKAFNKTITKPIKADNSTLNNSQTTQPNLNNSNIQSTNFNTINNQNINSNNLNTGNVNSNTTNVQNNNPNVQPTTVPNQYQKKKVPILYILLGTVITVFCIVIGKNISSFSPNNKYRNKQAVSFLDETTKSQTTIESTTEQQTTEQPTTAEPTTEQQTTKQPTTAELTTEQQTTTESTIEQKNYDYFFPSNTEYITYDFLNTLNKEQIGFIRNEIYARRGFIFKDIKYKEYFSNKPWYKPNPDFSDKDFSKIEKTNIETIVKYEEDQGWRDRFLFPSDKEYITYNDLDKLTKKEIAYIRNEIYARHGYIFNNEEYQNYFSTKTWYIANPNYDDSLLSAIEIENRETISQYEKDQGWR